MSRIRIPVASGGPTLTRDPVLSLAAISLLGSSAVAYNVVVGRTLGPTVLGHAAVALAVGMGAAQVATAGIGPAIVRFTAARRARGDDSAARRALAGGMGAAALLGLALGMAVPLSSPLWADRVGLPANLVVPVAWLIMLQSLYIALKAALYGLGRVVEYALAEAAAAVAFFGLLALCLTGASMSLLAPFLAANTAFVLLAGMSVWRGVRGNVVKGPVSSFPPTPSSTPLEDASPSMARYAAVATVGSTAALARLHLVVLVTGLLWSAAEVGRLQAALAFLPPVLLVPRALELALFPALAGAFGRGDADTFRDQTATAFEVAAVGLGVVAGGLLVAGPDLLVGLYGSEFSPALPALHGVLLAAWALGLAVPAVAALSGADAVAIPNAAGVAGLGTSLLAWLFLVPAYGATGAALGLALGSVPVAVTPLFAARRRYGLTFGAGMRVLARTAVSLGAALALTRGLGWRALPVAVLFGLALLATESVRMARRTPHRRRASA